MSAIDTAKEFVRLGSTVGLSKDVIDLLDKKALLLTEQVAALQEENTTLLRLNHNLATENQQLKTQLQNTHQKEKELDAKTLEVLKFFFGHPAKVCVSELAHHFNLKINVAKYHLEKLIEKEYVRCPGFVMGGGGEIGYTITSEGRKFIIEEGLES